MSQSRPNDPTGIAGILQGIFGSSGAPYEKGFEATKPYFESATNAQNPFAKAGQEAIPQFQSWTNSMSNPTSFINNAMNQYQESPWAKYLQQQSVRAGQNAASANGTIGSTPFAQQLQQNAQNISSQDMQTWLANVLGINTQYGGALNNQIQTGSHASDILSQLFSTQGNMAGGAAYGQEAGKQQDRNSFIAGLSKLLFGGGDNSSFSGNPNPFGDAFSLAFV
jgi:hypothetical protein